MFKCVMKSTFPNVLVPDKHTCTCFFLGDDFFDFLMSSLSLDLRLSVSCVSMKEREREGEREGERGERENERERERERKERCDRGGWGERYPNMDVLLSHSWPSGIPHIQLITHNTCCIVQYTVTNVCPMYIPHYN